MRYLKSCALVARLVGDRVWLELVGSYHTSDWSLRWWDYSYCEIAMEVVSELIYIDA